MLNGTASLDTETRDLATIAMWTRESLRFDDALNVKRIAINPEGGRFTVRSDNAAYPSWPDCDPARIAIIGRVVWVGRRVR